MAPLYTFILKLLTSRRTLSFCQRLELSRLDGTFARVLTRYGLRVEKLTILDLL
jgi:hypothetical protein